MVRCATIHLGAMPSLLLFRSLDVGIYVSFLVACDRCGRDEEEEKSGFVNKHATCKGVVQVYDVTFRKGVEVGSQAARRFLVLRVQNGQLPGIQVLVLRGRYS